MHFYLLLITTNVALHLKIEQQSYFQGHLPYCTVLYLLTYVYSLNKNSLEFVHYRATFLII